MLHCLWHKNFFFGCDDKKWKLYSLCVVIFQYTFHNIGFLIRFTHFSLVKSDSKINFSSCDNLIVSFALTFKGMGNESDSHFETSHLFITEPMGLKSTCEIAGIGPVYAERLKKQGFDKAYTVLGQFLVLKKQEELFVWWLQDICGASDYCARQAYQCLADWCNMFL